MIRAYEEIVEFIAAGITPDALIRFKVSQSTKDRVADLIRREKSSELTPAEISKLDHTLCAEHLIRLAKARARAICSP